MAEDNAEMTTARIVVDETGWLMESGKYTIQVRRGNLDAELLWEGEYIGTMPDAPDFFRAVKAMDREFREHYGGVE